MRADGNKHFGRDIHAHAMYTPEIRSVRRDCAVNTRNWLRGPCVAIVQPLSSRDCHHLRRAEVVCDCFCYSYSDSYTSLAHARRIPSGNPGHGTMNNNAPPSFVSHIVQARPQGYRTPLRSQWTGFTRTCAATTTSFSYLLPRYTNAQRKVQKERVDNKGNRDSATVTENTLCTTPNTDNDNDVTYIRHTDA